MNTKRIGLISILVVGLMLQVLSPVSNAYANVRTGNGGDLPFYARIEPGGGVYHTEEWAVIIFYRPPECIPDDFNFFDFFDFNAFACTPYTTEGFTIWKNGPSDPAPIQVKLFGLGAVPVWFVPWPVMKSVIADGLLTITELEALSPLIGYADFYEETLHPSGGSHPSMGEFTAQGDLEDGRAFYVHITAPPNTPYKIRISIK